MVACAIELIFHEISFYGSLQTQVERDQDLLENSKKGKRADKISWKKENKAYQDFILHLENGAFAEVCSLCCVEILKCHTVIHV